MMMKVLSAAAVALAVVAAPAQAAVSPGEVTMRLNAKVLETVGADINGVLNLARKGRLGEVLGGRMQTQACQTQSCVEGCLRPIEAFANNDCLGTGDSVLGNIFSDDEDEAEDEAETDLGDTFDNLFPDFDNVTADSAAQYDEFCECTATISGFFRSFFRAFECIGLDLDDLDDDDDDDSGSGDSDGVVVVTPVDGDGASGSASASASDSSSVLSDPDALIDLLEAMFGFLCIKSGEDYCFIILEEVEAAYREEGINLDDFDDLDDDVQCEAVAETGCCIPSFIEAIRDPQLTGIVSEDGGGDINSTIVEMEAGLVACGFSTEPCLAPGESDTFVKAVVRIDASFSVLAADENKLRAFKRGFRRDVAASLDGVTEPQVQINDVRNGSVIVDFQIRGAENKAKLDAAVATGIPLDNTREEVTEFAGVEDVTSDDATVTEAVIENETDPSPAAAAAPSMVLAALMALFAALL